MKNISTTQVQDILEDYKAIDILLLEVNNLTPLFDYIFICTATSKRHVRGISEYLIRHFKEKMPQTPSSEGLEECEWVLIDLGNIIVHVMLAEAREFYRLEQLWQLSNKKPTHE